MAFHCSSVYGFVTLGDSNIRLTEFSKKNSVSHLSVSPDTGAALSKEGVQARAIS